VAPVKLPQVGSVVGNGVMADLPGFGITVRWNLKQPVLVGFTQISTAIVLHIFSILKVVKC